MKSIDYSGPGIHGGHAQRGAFQSYNQMAQNIQKMPAFTPTEPVSKKNSYDFNCEQIPSNTVPASAKGKSSIDLNAITSNIDVSENVEFQNAMECMFDQQFGMMTESRKANSPSISSKQRLLSPEKNSTIPHESEDTTTEKPPPKSILKNKRDGGLTSRPVHSALNS